MPGCKKVEVPENLVVGPDGLVCKGGRSRTPRILLCTVQTKSACLPLRTINTLQRGTTPKMMTGMRLLAGIGLTKAIDAGCATIIAIPNQAGLRAVLHANARNASACPKSYGQ